MVFFKNLVQFSSDEKTKNLSVEHIYHSLHAIFNVMCSRGMWVVGQLCSLMDEID